MIPSEKRLTWKRSLDGYEDVGLREGVTVSEAICKLAELEEMDAVKVIHGRWTEKVDMVNSYLSDCTEVFYECSVCECANLGESSYCPNCGAKMDKEGEM